MGVSNTCEMTKLIQNKFLPFYRHQLSKTVRNVSTNIENINFSDYQTVFKYKSTSDLLRNLCLLRVCSINKFVDNALPIMRGSEKVLGEKAFSAVARPTFYKQFVGGDTEQELTHTSDQLSRSRLRLMVCPAMEEDAGEGVEGEEKYDFNMEYIKNIGDIMIKAGAIRPCLQFKITAMAPADLVTKISGLISDNTIDMKTTVKSMGQCLSSGMTARITQLTDEENEQLNAALARFKIFGEAGRQNGLHLLVDAEYTYMNKGISAFALAMMMAFNKDKPIVWNTYQCYLKEALNTISSEMEVVQSLGNCFGAKIVRGAYMDKERKLAKMNGYEDPVNDTYEATGEMYNIVVATHNEAGALHAASKLLQKGIPPDSGRVVFGQIYGMAEQISIPLAAAGFTVYKSVPYGPLTEVLPYLSRRAAENKVVLAGARREQELLVKEIKRRVMSRLRLSNWGERYSMQCSGSLTIEF